MREILTTEQTSLLERLFTPEERWGWEYREPEALQAPFPHPRPVLRVPLPEWASRIGPRLDRADSRRAVSAVGAALAALVALAVNLHAVVWALLLLAIAGVVAFLGLVRPWLLHREAGARHREWMQACLAAHDRYREQHRNWAREKSRHQQRERLRLAASPEWVPIRPRPTDRVDLYGGTSQGWEAFITTAGASLLASGARLTVVDLSQDAPAAELAQLAELHGHAVDVLVLPEQLREVDLLAGLTAGEACDVIVEALHGQERDASHETRSMDARILGGVCEALAPAPLSLGRICAGLRVLLRQEQPPPPGGGALAPEEYRRISDLFGETFRTSAEPRIAALEVRLHSLVDAGRKAGRRPLEAPAARLRVIAISPEGSELLNDMLAHLLLQLLIRAMRREGTAGSGQAVLLVAGADTLRRRHLERLDQLARQRGISLVYLFRHLRDEAVELLGGGGAFFMRLGNAREAAGAAEFIGREHRFTLHQLTRSSGQSVTGTAGDSVADTVGTSTSAAETALPRFLMPLPVSNSYTQGRSTSRTWGQSRSVATATTTNVSPVQQRVYELEVEPRTLQTLPETAFLYVEHDGGQGPRGRLGDCNPDILMLPNVSAEPLRS